MLVKNFLREGTKSASFGGDVERAFVTPDGFIFRKGLVLSPQNVRGVTA